MPLSPDPAPESAEAKTSLLEAALHRHDLGDLDGAEDLFRRILGQDARHFIATHQLGVIANQRGHYEDAAQILATALQLHPRSALAHMNRGVALWNLGRAEEALQHYQLALLINPKSVEALLNQAVALRSLGRSEQARAALEKARSLEPEDGRVLRALAGLLQELHRHEEALACLDEALRLRPDDADALTDRGAVRQALGDPQRGLEDHDRALSLRPDHADALLNRGTALLDLQRPEQALASIDRSLALTGERADGLMNRGNALLQLRRFSEALAAFDRSLVLAPQSTSALKNRALALHLMGRHEAAIADLDRVLALDPSDAAAHSPKIFMLDFLPELSFARHQEERRRFFEMHGPAWPVTPLPARDRNPGRPLVLGYVSADFCEHSAAVCFGPILRHHDRSAFKVICYSGVLTEDDRTREFQGFADQWVRSSRLGDDDLAERIRQDGVDILIDLSGHSTGNRLPVFGRRPAPIQVTAWGHGGGTGLPMIDYQFTDPIHIPDGVRPLFAESSYDLPCCITFDPPPFAPPVTDLPARSKGHLTFGCLNRFSKITPGLMEQWAELLLAVPRSRLLLKDGVLDDPQVRARVLATFEKRGVGAERLDLRGRTSRQAHLAVYGEVDITLDTFPQNGGITTWESLWMGVPVVALLGDHPACRLSAAILGALGLEAWTARDADTYVDLALRQAADLEALAQLRAGLRERIRTSAAGNPERYTRAVEAAYRSFWHRWLERNPEPPRPF
ncbi:acetylglucosamine transferase [Geothrix limicola]|uniref:protein O-GlcNAc transferase n=1 Tax=Geothrix limicola TaxID=2927978 RepID=A0ABQ5QE95_9BACT|nr:tetratricopeptide repeat protein [Geothrix limicola]GLH73165.1 acetylglucosamine transferase [Geothrix limicola]